MFDRMDSRRSKSSRGTRSATAILVAGAAWFAACADEPGPIEPRNQAPVVFLAMPNLNVVVGTADTINVSGYFVDPDGDSLSYSARSSNTAIAVTQISGDGLTVHGVAQGRATITVTARDPGGLAATQEFDVTVRNADWIVLVSLFEAMRGRGWFRKNNWMTDQPIDTWQGVEVDSTGRVAGLRLGKNNLKNTIPPILGDLSGLQALDLRENKLSGPIPSALFGLKRLNYLDLADNGLEGSISGRVGLLSALTHLDLSHNDLTGPIPDGLGNLSSLTTLWLRNNDLTGPIPAGLGDLTSLTGLQLQSNDLTGPIPAALGNLSSLRLLWLYDNDLTGPIPAELGRLGGLPWLDLSNNELTGSIPPELGDMASLETLNLYHNQLTGSIPAELDNLNRLNALALRGNNLTGTIPPELGGLPDLFMLDVADNELTGPIPPELGDLRDLAYLFLGDNELTGSIPAELGRLTLTFLSLRGNNLTGVIPSQFGDLLYIRSLDLSDNDLEAPIPPELGRLVSLNRLDLSNNSFAAPIPPEILGLRELRVLELSGNSLTGPIPVDLLTAYNLEELYLADNDLTAPLPDELGDLRRLVRLDLRRNPRLSDEIPVSWTGLSELETLAAHDTDLCAPADPSVLDWLGGVLTHRLPSCGVWDAYLVQAMQSREFPVPLVAGRDALLRVFPTALRSTEAGIPPVRATFYLDGAETHQVEIPAKSAPIPTTIDEGSLEKSANADIPGPVVQPGLEIVIEIDPEGTLDPELGVVGRIPAEGRLPVRVVDVPDLDFTLIPFLWSEDPDSAILGLVEEMAERPETHEMFSQMRAMLPVTDVTATVHEPVWTSTNVVFELFSETAAIRILEQGSHLAGVSRYTGMMSVPVEGGSETGYAAGRVAFVTPEATAFAQVVGGLSGLDFAPCGETHWDPYYPHEDGSIGAWGYDARAGQLISPTTLDLMSHCAAPRWISDYHFAKAARFRRIDAGVADVAPGTSTRSLLLWGGVGGDGVPYLEPAFVVDAPPASPPPGSDHEIAGRTARGDELFSLRFGMPEVVGGGGASFVFAIPVEPVWAQELAVITLSGPGGSATLDLDTDQPMTIVRNPETGQVRGILRGSAALGPAAADGGGDSLPLHGLEAMTSRGIPEADAWRR